MRTDSLDANNVAGVHRRGRPSGPRCGAGQAALARRPRVARVFAAGVAGVAALLLAATMSAQPAQEDDHPQAKVSFDDFKQLVTAVEAHREERLVDLDTFLTMSREPGVVVLDSRSAMRFARRHLAGARHLNFSDFTQESLAEVIPSFDTTILIYCNNNFEGDPIDFASKTIQLSGASPAQSLPPGPESPDLLDPFLDPMRLRMMALNVPTYVNLYGYGYHNVYELDELVDVNDPRVTFAGSAVAKPAEAAR